MFSQQRNDKIRKADLLLFVDTVVCFQGPDGGPEKIKLGKYQLLSRKLKG